MLAVSSCRRNEMRQKNADFQLINHKLAQNVKWLKMQSYFGHLRKIIRRRQLSWLK